VLFGPFILLVGLPISQQTVLRYLHCANFWLVLYKKNNFSVPPVFCVLKEMSVLQGRSIVPELQSVISLKYN